jgi:prepilin-type processing-associated H-X9-DG protein
MSYEEIIQVRPLSEATNTAILTDSQQTQLARYLKSAGVFKCPSDKSYAIRPVDGRSHYPRARSYSMDQTIGDSSRDPYNSAYYYYKPGDFSAVSSSQVFLFLDEHEDSINDGYFFIGRPDGRAVGLGDHPASRHNKGANFVFADGHAEKHKWKDPRIIQPITRKRLFAFPLPNSPDVAWIHDHALIKK